MISSFITDATPTTDFETITVSSTAIGFTTSKILQHQLGGERRRAVKAFVTVEGAGNIRIRSDGAAPTSTIGHRYGNATCFTVVGEQDIINFRAIATSSDMTIHVSYVFNR